MSYTSLLKWVNVTTLCLAAASCLMAAFLGEGQQLLMFVIGAGSLHAVLSLAGA